MGFPTGTFSHDAYHTTVGTPDERSWPGVSQLPDWKSTFPKWSAQKLEKVVPTLTEEGYDILKV